MNSRSIFAPPLSLSGKRRRFSGRLAPIFTAEVVSAKQPGAWDSQRFEPDTESASGERTLAQATRKGIVGWPRR
jgi:hypothetical protein